jgi:hypothetical protein
MVGEVFASLNAVKTAFDIAKGLKDITDAAARNAAVIELQEHIISAQAAQSALVERVRELEKEVANFETWKADKQQYELKYLGLGAHAYMLKPDARGTKPPHWICTHCYGDRRTEIIQYTSIGGVTGFFCPACHNKIEPSHEAMNADTASFKWLD